MWRRRLVEWRVRLGLSKLVQAYWPALGCTLVGAHQWRRVGNVSSTRWVRQEDGRLALFETRPSKCIACEKEETREVDLTA